MQYGRGVSQRQVLGDMLGPQVQAIMARSGLDLGTDPILVSFELREKGGRELTSERTTADLPSDYPGRGD